MLSYLYYTTSRYIYQHASNSRTGCHDGNIYLWKAFEENDSNYNVLSGHRKGITDLSWSTCDGNTLYSSSADHTAGAWDSVTGNRTRVFRPSTGIVNGISASLDHAEVCAVVTDLGYMKVFDARKKGVAMMVGQSPQAHEACPWLAVCYGSPESNSIYTGGLDGLVQQWDIRKLDQPKEVFRQHTGPITGLSLSPDMTHVLSNSSDGSMCMWDTRPFMTSSRCRRTFETGPRSEREGINRCAWSGDGMYVAAMCAADKTVCVWNSETGKLEYKLPGHTTNVHCVAFHPNQPILGSCSADGVCYLGEIEL